NSRKAAKRAVPAPHHSDRSESEYGTAWVLGQDRCVQGRPAVLILRAVHQDRHDERRTDLPNQVGDRILACEVFTDEWTHSDGVADVYETDMAPLHVDCFLPLLFRVEDLVQSVLLDLGFAELPAVVLVLVSGLESSPAVSPFAIAIAPHVVALESPASRRRVHAHS